MSKTKNTMIPLVGSIVVVCPRDKDGKLVQMSPPVGKPFEFSDDELADIKRLSPNAIRKPVNEAEATSEEDPDAEPEESIERDELRAIAKPADGDVGKPEGDNGVAKKVGNKTAKDDLGGL
jgi:hypothetical protein